MFSHVRRTALRLCGHAVSTCDETVDTRVEAVDSRGKLAVLAAVFLAKLAQVAAKFAVEPKTHSNNQPAKPDE